MRARLVLTIVTLGKLAAQAVPGGPVVAPLTLAQAEATALRAHAQIQSAQLRARAAGENVTEARAPELPQLLGNLTGAGASTGARLAAGGLNNPIVYDRFASGLNATQLITDFGRTRNLVESARERANARTADVETIKDQIVLAVDRAYFGALRARAVRSVAQATVTDRQTVADQVSALAASKLKSDVDVSFAQVNLSAAQLELSDADNEYQAQLTELSYALGYSSKQNLDPSEEPLPGDLPSDLNALIDAAIRKRPELASLRSEQQAAESLARAERDLRYPSISAIASTGYVPVFQGTIREGYAAAGVNVAIPILNGGLFSARRAEAEYRSQAALQDVRDRESRVARDVRIAYLDAVNALERMALTRKLVQQAQLGLELAQARYRLGLSSIVELSQAQLNASSAQVAVARAKYDYQTERAVLAYQIGSIR